MNPVGRLAEFEVPVAGRRVSCLLAEPHRPAARPALLVNLAADRHTSLLNHPYDIPVRAFLAAGHRAVSFDLPCHGERRGPSSEQGIAGMRDSLLAGEDPFAVLVADGRAVVDAMLDGGVGTPGRIVTAGTSRGGYCALRLMAADARVAGAAAFAPVTDWRTLTEFAAVSDRADVAALSLVRYAEALAGRPVWIGIGNCDKRVGTDVCISFAQAILAAEAAKGLSGSQLSLHVVPEAGHTLSDAWRQAGADFLLSLVSGPA